MLRASVLPEPPPGARGASVMPECRTGTTSATASGGPAPSSSKNNASMATSNPRNAATKALLERSLNKTRGM